MGKTNYFRIFAMLAFAALAAFSCKWTADSLYMWHPDLTIYGAWTIAVLSFVIASLCFTQLLKSFDRNEDFYDKPGGRWGAFAVGILGLTFFWVFVSLPTNTHTLLYGASVKTVLTQDLSRTKGYLQDLQKNNTEIKRIESDRDALKAQIYSRLESMQNEIEHPGIEGIGYRFNAIVTDVEKILSGAIGLSVKIPRVERPGSSKREWYNTYQFYQTAIIGNLEKYNNSCNEKIRRVREAMNDKELNVKIKNISLAEEDISEMRGVNHNIIKAAENDLVKDYAYIKKYSDYLNFKSEEDRARYTAEFPKTDAEDLLNVQQVIKDYAKTDRYDGMGYWILIAILVDIAGFVFFNIAFKSRSI